MNNFLTIMKNYIKFTIKAIRYPNAKQEEFYGTFITIIVLAMFVGFATLVTPLAKVFTDNVFLHLFLKPFFQTILLIGTSFGVIWIIALLMKSGLFAKDLFMRFGNYLVIPKIMFLLAFFIGLFFYNISTYFYTIGNMGIILATSMTLVSIRRMDERGMDIYHAIIFSFALIIIVAKIFMGGEYGTMFVF